jgi:hypothetical protein
LRGSKRPTLLMILSSEDWAGSFVVRGCAQQGPTRQAEHSEHGVHGFKPRHPRCAKPHEKPEKRPLRSLVKEYILNPRITSLTQPTASTSGKPGDATTPPMPAANQAVRRLCLELDEHLESSWLWSTKTTWSAGPRRFTRTGPVVGHVFTGRSRAGSGRARAIAVSRPPHESSGPMTRRVGTGWLRARVERLRSFPRCRIPETTETTRRPGCWAW